MGRSSSATATPQVKAAAMQAAPAHLYILFSLIHLAHRDRPTSSIAQDKRNGCEVAHTIGAFWGGSRPNKRVRGGRPAKEAVQRRQRARGGVTASGPGLPSSAAEASSTTSRPVSSRLALQVFAAAPRRPPKRIREVLFWPYPAPGLPRPPRSSRTFQIARHMTRYANKADEPDFLFLGLGT